MLQKLCCAAVCHPESASEVPEMLGVQMGGLVLFDTTNDSFPSLGKLELVQLRCSAGKHVFGQFGL